MPRGKKTDNETIYKIMISMFSTGNTMETARQLNIPRTTIEQIYKTHKDDEKFVKLRKEKQDDFAEKATRLIDKALKRLEESLDNKEERIPVNNLSTVIGTLYDKRALTKGESTQNNAVTIKMSDEVKELSE